MNRNLSDGQFYHLSATRNRGAIQEQGLRLPEGGDRAVWLFPHRRDAQSFLPTSFGLSRGRNDLWEVDASGMKVEPDPHPGWEGIESSVVRQDVPAERIRLVEAYRGRSYSRKKRSR